MWVFLKDAFLSIVDAPDDPCKLVVRARVRGDIERVFADVEVLHTPDRDYAYRALIGWESVADAMHHEVQKIDYPNFKDAVKEHFRHDAYLAVWHRMAALQEREERPASKPRAAKSQNRKPQKRKAVR